MIIYRVHTELHIKRHIGLYIAFGIAAYNNHRRLFRISDAFVNRRRAEHFVSLCNREQPSPIHIRDILEDVM